MNITTKWQREFADQVNAMTEEEIWEQLIDIAVGMETSIETARDNWKTSFLRYTQEWQKAYVCRMQAMSNEELLDKALMDAQGDDYDGCFTASGWWRHQKNREILLNRMNGCGCQTKQTEE